MNRREALVLITASATSATGFAQSRSERRVQNSTSPNVFEPRNFGATGNGTTLDSPAINAAIDACTKAGGGVVYCAPGKYLCGTVYLKINVTL